ncbi:restriction endonuclease subunit S [[Mycoplasma] falconis]|uniref:Restriction endonuclease subunit S n=1 Tax=[Mycoplasma] falconis TaxID=92403 RepID=A0A501XA73_9BACT|nr:restriction endonuclease subunit S [[Mycoplasma] falconis]TPE57376.1 restriction endonuclease subunit S [[Mycoplasma] falconis]
MLFKNIIQKIIDNRGKSVKNSSEKGLRIIQSFLVKNTRYPKNLSKAKILDFKEIKKFIRDNLNKNDLLISTCGNIGCVTLAPEKSCVIQTVIGFRFIDSISPLYMFYYFASNTHILTNLNIGPQDLQ